MHRTPTIDLVIVLSGRVELVLDAETVQLGPGDTVVQEGHGQMRGGCSTAGVVERGDDRQLRT